MRDVKVANELYLAAPQQGAGAAGREGGDDRATSGSSTPPSCRCEPVAPQKARGARPGPPPRPRARRRGGVRAPRARRRASRIPRRSSAALGIGVNASVPHSARPGSTPSARAHGDREPHAASSRRTNPKDLAVESLRSLRTSLQFALVEARNANRRHWRPGAGRGEVVRRRRTWRTSSARPGSGSSSWTPTSAAGTSTTTSALDRGVGLSDAIAGQVPALNAIRATRSPNVSVLTTGRDPAEPRRAARERAASSGSSPTSRRATTSSSSTPRRSSP